MKLAGIVVAYYPDKGFFLNIKSYLNFIEKLYIVDNTDNKNAETPDFGDNDIIEYIPMHRNIGCEALNIGCQKAREDGYDYIMLLDQDTRFEGNSAEILIDFVKRHPTYAAYAPNISAIDDDGTVFYTLMNRDDVEECNWTTGSGQVLSLSILDEIGNFDEKLFIDHVDVDLGVRIYKAGYKTVRIGRALIYQRYGHSKPQKLLWKTVYPKYADKIRVYYVFRNQKYLEMKYGKSVNKITKFSLLKSAVKILLFEDKKIEKARMAILGIKDARNGVMGKCAHQ